MEEKEAVLKNFFRSLLSFKLSFRSLLRRTNSSGFTLVEILVVLALIGILAAGFFIIIDPVQQLRRTRDSDRKSDLKVIQAALELYRSDQGGYKDPTVGIANTPANTTDGKLLDDSGNITYLQEVPKDPKYTTTNGGTGHYYYCTNTAAPCSAPTSGYSLFACAENKDDKDAITLSSALSGFDCSATGLNPIKYYKVTSP